MPARPDAGHRLRSELVSKLRGRSDSDAKILFVGILNHHLPRGQRAILVGGALVQFYTAGAYVTGDIDLMGNRKAIGEALKAAGFVEEGRYFSHPDLHLVVEVPGDSLRGGEHVVEIEFEGYRIPSVRLEDAIVDRLLAAKYWKSATDWEQALLLYATHAGRVDSKILAARAEEERVEDVLEQLISTVK